MRNCVANWKGYCYISFASLNFTKRNLLFIFRNNVSVGPITPSTRKVYEIKLMKIAQSKGEDAEDFVQNISLNSPLSVSNAKNKQINLQPESPTRDNNGATYAAANSGSRNGSPVVSQKLQNGNASGSPSKKLKPQSANRGDKSLLNNTQEVFMAVQTPSGFGTVEQVKGGQVSRFCKHFFGPDFCADICATL
jgi:hypothetical protein